MKEERENGITKFMPYILSSSGALILLGAFLFGGTYQNIVDNNKQARDELYRQSELAVTASELLTNDDDISYDQKNTLINKLIDNYSAYIECMGKRDNSSERCSIERDKISMEIGVIDAYLEKSGYPTFEDFNELISKDELDELIEQESKTEEGE